MIELAARVWVNKYALKDSYGNIYEKTPDDMHWRIANEIARIEQKYPNPLSSQELFDLMKSFRYIVPQGSPMSSTVPPTRMEASSKSTKSRCN